MTTGGPGGPSRPATVAWSLFYLAFGYVAMAALTLAAVAALAPAFPGLPSSMGGLALVQAAIGIGVFGGLTLVIGRRLLRLDRRELGWAPARSGGVTGFGRGLGLGLVVGAGALALGAPFGSGWTGDGGGFAAYLLRIGVLAAVLLPAAFMEELVFRGVALAGLTRALGPGAGIVITSVLFGLAHRLNPAVTPLALGNITLAGIFLALTFFARGGLWTATGAHLGWNLALAGLGAPVSGLPFEVPWLDFRPADPAWLSGGGFGPEGGLLATVALGAGIVVAARWRYTRETT